MNKIIPFILTLLICGHVHANNLPPHSGTKTTAEDLWEIWGGSIELVFNQDILRDFKISVSSNQIKSSKPTLVVPFRDQSSLQIWAPQAAFDGYANGQLSTINEFKLQSTKSSIDLSNFTIRPAAKDNLTLEIIDQQGQVVFVLSHIHSKVNLPQGTLTLKNMDINLSASAAQRLQRPELAGMSMGVGYMTSNLQLPAGVTPELLAGGSCNATNAQWDDGVNFQTDVALVNMSQVSQVNSLGDQVAIAPSATLENVGTADVPWYDKFTTGTNGTYPAPYDADQHPFLVWNLYRLVDGKLEQLGASGLKHAFFTVNTGCSCPGGNILWADNSPVNSGGCLDTYGVGNNNSQSAVGIREEVNAADGTWEQCGSMFAPDGVAPGPCAEQNFSIPFSTMERRLYVNNDDLATPGARYFLEGWYVIRDDINIFNSMGFREITPTGSAGSWTFVLNGAYQSGPVVDLWVDPNTPGPMASSELIQNNLGHVQVVSQAEDLGNGQYRYTYAVMNHDFSTGLKGLTLPTYLPAKAHDFDDPDYDTNNDWAMNFANEMITWTPPTVDDFHPWGTLYVFSIDINAAPTSSQVQLTDNDNNTYLVDVIGPPAGEIPIFADDFEDNKP